MPTQDETVGNLSEKVGLLGKGDRLDAENTVKFGIRLKVSLPNRKS